MFSSEALVALIVLVLAFGIDRIGEPPETLHPTVWMGRISKLIMRCSGSHERFCGSASAILIILLFGMASYMILRGVLDLFGLIAYVIAASVVLKTTFSLKTMESMVLPVVRALEEGDIEEARLRVQRVVRRETANLHSGLIASAAVESIAESTVDGVTGPLFFYGLSGVIGAVAYRVINTLDSMVGYKTPEFINVGWFSAKLDSLANYIPARLTGCLMVLSARLLGDDYRKAMETISKDSGSTESLNAGWPMSAMAGALNVRLEKQGHYSLGKEFAFPEVKDIRRAIRIMYLSSFLFMLLVTMPLIALTIPFQPILP